MSRRRSPSSRQTQSRHRAAGPAQLPAVRRRARTPLIAWPGRLVSCTTGFLFHNPECGYFGSTAGHCGQVRAGVAIARPHPCGRGAGQQLLPEQVGDRGHGLHLDVGLSLAGLADDQHGQRRPRRHGPHLDTAARHRARLCFEGVTATRATAGRWCGSTRGLCATPRVTATSAAARTTRASRATAAGRCTSRRGEPGDGGRHGVVVGHDHRRQRWTSFTMGESSSSS